MDQPSLLLTPTGARVCVGEGPGVLAGQETYEAVVELANLDQLRLNPDHRFRRLRVIVSRTPFTYYAQDPADTQHTPNAPMHELPVLVMALLADAPDDFATSDAEFYSFLSRLHMNGESGYILGASADVPGSSDRGDDASDPLPASPPAPPVPAASAAPVASAVP